jgi:hypothetical protein
MATIRKHAGDADDDRTDDQAQKKKRRHGVIPTDLGNICWRFVIYFYFHELFNVMPIVSSRMLRMQHEKASPKALLCFFSESRNIFRA